MMTPLFYAIGLFMGGAFMYTHLRAKYHRGCGDFLHECATLVNTGRFDPDTVAIAFVRTMPWQGDA